MSGLVAATVMTVFLTSPAWFTWLVCRVDRRAEERARAERDETTRRMVLALCEATFPTEGRRSP